MPESGESESRDIFNAVAVLKVADEWKSARHIFLNIVDHMLEAATNYQQEVNLQFITFFHFNINVYCFITYQKSYRQNNHSPIWNINMKINKIYRAYHQALQVFFIEISILP